MDDEPKTLEDFLNLHVVNDLNKLVKLVVIEGRAPTRKADLIAAIVNEFIPNLQDYWNALDETQQLAVSEAIYAQKFDQISFALKYGQEPHWGEQSQWSSSIKTPSLLNLFILQKSHNYYTSYQRVVPEDLKVILKKWVSKPPAAQISTLESQPTSVIQIGYAYNQKTYEREEVSNELPLYQANTEQTAQADLLSVLRLIETGKIKISDKTGYPTKSSINTITEILQSGDFYPDQDSEDAPIEPPGAIRAFAWPVMIHAAKLARSKSGKLELTPKGRKALTEPTHEIIKTLWQSWLSNKNFDELRRVNNIKGQTGKGKRGLTPPKERRHIIVQTLKQCPTDSWLAFEDFFDFMRILGHILIVSEDPYELYIGTKYYGDLGHNSGLLTLCYTLVFLFEYMATLGLIDITYLDPADTPWEFDYEINSEFLSRYDGLTHFKINNLGAYCLGLKRSYTPTKIEVEHTLKILPNADIVALKPIPKSDQIVLEQFAEKTSDSVWTIRSEKLLKSIEMGQSLDHMHTFLKQKGGTELPQPITVLFQDMADKASNLKSQGMAHLIEVKDATTAQFLALEHNVKKHCFLAGKHHLIVPEKSLTAFRSALRKIGYVLPK